MAITLPFSDDFASGTSPNASVYTAIAGSLSDYSVSGSFALVADPHTSTDQREGFYTTDTVSGDFDVKWKLNMTENPVGQTGTVHGVALWIDNNNMIKMWRYYRSDLGWYNPSCQKVVSGSTTTLHDNTSAGGDSDTGNYDRYYRIKKSGTTFTFYTSPDGSTWTTEYTGTISDWASGQAWHVMTYGENNANTNLLKLDRLTIDPLTTTYNQSVIATTAITGKLTKGMSKTLAATTAVSGSVFKQLARSLVANTAITASMVKQMAKTLVGNVSVSATMEAIRVYLVSLTATTEISAVITKIPGKLLSSTAAVSASITKTLSAARTLTATTAVSGSITKGLSKTLQASAAVSAAITKTPGKLLKATTAVSASVSSGLAKILVATTEITASIEAGRAVIMVATTAVSSTITKTPQKMLVAITSIIAKMRAPFYRVKYPAHGDGDDYEVKYPHDTI